MARALVAATVVALVGMTSFQLLKNYFIGGMTLVESQAYSVLFVTAVTVVCAFFFLRRYDRVFDRMEAEAERRLRGESELRVAVDRLRTMETTVNDSPVTVVRWGANDDWSVSYVSDNIARYGFTAQEFTSGALSFEDIIHPDDRERAIAESLHHIQSGAGHFMQEYRIVARGGDVHWIEDRTSVRRAEDGTPLHDDGVIVDITERRRIEGALRESEERFRTIYETSPIGILLLGRDGRAMAINSAGLRIFGFADVEGLASYDLFRTPNLSEDTRDRLRDGEPVRADGLAVDFELARAAGQYDSAKTGIMYVDLILTPVARGAESKGSGLGFVAQIQDVSARKLIEGEIEHMAYHDQVTGLPNRILFEDRLQVAIARAHRDKHAVAVFFIDIDDFKNVNDLLGHDIGDLLLQSVGARLRSCLRDADSVARLGGDEFTMVLPAIGGEEYAEQVAQRIQETMQPEVILGEHSVEVTASIGIALYPGDGVDAKSLIRKADMAMYVVKDRGKAGYEFAMRAGGV